MALNTEHSLAKAVLDGVAATFEALEAVTLLVAKWRCVVILPSQVPITPEILSELVRLLPASVVVEHRTQVLRRPGSNVALGVLDLLAFKSARVESNSAIDVVIASSQAVVK